ncbi:MAG: DNA mismatch repair endonuclease MutL [Clostridiales bacterium]|nr:DNA mismatch repair endonuclease MutL [Clostridiales bacterium]
MPKINILPPKVFNRIAAGEVVDRPYSVVKELVENSIDAGATEIEIYIEKSGEQMIRVVDNGCGIERDDLHSAFLPHATSKIAQAEDLESIMTLGFRGEAVASIAAVSRMTITSKTAAGKCYSLHAEGGEVGQITETAGENGTIVTVEDLFYNTPVRFKFLKSDRAEEADITNFVSRFILSRPDIAFTYYANGKKVLQSFGGGAEEAFVNVYGAAVLSQCYEINAEKHGLRIRGYIGNQNFFKPNKSYQSVFLNGRYIQNVTITSAIAGAYANYAMKRQYPFYVLYIDMPTEIVDVNVHPNKADVRFADNQVVYGIVNTVIAAILDGHAKALEYVVRQPSSGVYEAEEPKTASKNEQITVQEEKTLPMTPFLDKFKAEESIEEKPKTNTVFGIATLSYEEAQKELEACAPAFTAKVKGVELPFEEKKKETKTPVKGFIPKEEIGPYVPPVGYKDMPPPGRTKKKAEDLQKRFPDLYFKRNVFELNDPNYAKAQKQKEALDAFSENKRLLEELDKKNKQNAIDVSSCVYAGKLFNTYLMYECKDDIYIIDQHAAHERLIYNRLKRQMAERNVVQQPMLVPYELELNVFEREFIGEHIEEIREMGFEIAENDRKGYSITAIPLDLQHINIEAFFNEILGDISGYRAIRLTDILKDKLASAACKAAVKGGMDLTREEIDALFALMDGDMGLKCPHGRPVVVKMSRTEIEKMFKRIV